jgi:acyl-CoA-dependent ceramide synthase
MGGLLKWYYLVQYAFWLQQILVVNIEERRKDYHQMLTHHIITCGLMFLSYGYHLTKVGNLILCIMDVGDLILPVRIIPPQGQLCIWPQEFNATNLHSWPKF